MSFLDKNAKIYIAGHTGLVGSAVLSLLKQQGFNNLITAKRADLDLTNFTDVDNFFALHQPDFVVMAAAKVGGIVANDQYSADFIYQNIMIQSNIIKSAHQYNVKRMIFFGSSCIYPKNCDQPIKEEYLLTGKLEPTNKAFAVAKIAGITMCEAFNKQYGTNFLTVMSTNLYGQNDNYDLNHSHVLPALMRKFHEAKVNKSSSVTLWGTGIAQREFLHSNDLAHAVLFLLNLPEEIYQSLLFDKTTGPVINVGTGVDLSIAELAGLIRKVVGYPECNIAWDETKPDGTLKKLLDISRILALGWQPKISLQTGIEEIYKNNFVLDEFSAVAS